MHPEEVNQFIQSRVSIFPKDFIEGEIIEKKVLESILENASWAPTHRFTEPWFFKVYAKNGKDILLQKCLEVYTEVFGDEKAEAFREKLKNKLSKSSHIVLICMKRDPKESIPEWEEIASVSCAVQNLHLSLNCHNIGGYWSSPGYCAKPEMNIKFNLGKQDKCLGFFFLGKIDPDILKKSNRIRKSVDSFTEWIDE